MNPFFLENMSESCSNLFHLTLMFLYLIRKTIILISRNYRPNRVETPSYTGGVSDKFREQKSRKGDKRRHEGLYASSKNSRNDKGYTCI